MSILKDKDTVHAFHERIDALERHVMESVLSITRDIRALDPFDQEFVDGSFGETLANIAGFHLALATMIAKPWAARNALPYNWSENAEKKAFARVLKELEKANFQYTDRMATGDGIVL